MLLVTDACLNDASISTITQYLDGGTLHAGSSFTHDPYGSEDF